MDERIAVVRIVQREAQPFSVENHDGHLGEHDATHAFRPAANAIERQLLGGALRTVEEASLPRRTGRLYVRWLDG